MTITSLFARSMYIGTESERSTFGTGLPVGARFWCTDSTIMYVWTGAAWVGVSGFGGAATQWDDLVVGAYRLVGARDPVMTKLLDDGAGSRGVYTLVFGDELVNENELFFEAQLPHGWKEQSTITPHVHWTPTVNGALNEKVKWGMEYAIANVSAVYGNTTIITANTTVQGDTTLVAHKHYITHLGDITMSGKLLSCVIRGRLFRNSSDTTNDTYSDGAALLSLDFHVEKDTLGSDLAYTK